MKFTLRNLLFAFLFCTVSVPSYGTVTISFDQTCNDGAPGALYNLSFGPIGQEFKPALLQMDFADLWIGDMDTYSDDATLNVNVRENDFSGLVIGTSEQSIVSAGSSGPVRFWFSVPLILTPNSTYFLDVSLLSGTSWGIGGVGDQYPNGTAIFWGTSQEIDYWFAEGIVVPEPPSGSLLLVGIVMLVCIKFVRFC
jgi:hypothetical protein